MRKLVLHTHVFVPSQVMLVLVACAVLCSLASCASAQASFSYPSGCTMNVDCTYHFTWEIPANDSTRMEITMNAHSSGWVGLAFSETGMMVRFANRLNLFAIT